MIPRLNYRNLIKENLSGFSRAMVTVARHFLFDEFEDMSVDEKIEGCRTILQLL